MPLNVLYVLDAFAILWFLVSYWKGCYKRGYRIDFWHLNLFLTCVLPNLLLLPFTRNDLNGIVLGRDFGAVMSVLPTVFEITLFGYFAILAGGSLWRLHLGAGFRRSTTRVLRIPYHLSMMMMASREVLVFQAAICLLMETLVLANYFAHQGFGFNLRAYTFANPALRPIALLASNYSITIAGYCLARYVDTKEKVLLKCTILLSVALIFFGSRANVLGIYITVLICYLMKLRSRISLVRIFSLAFVTVTMVLYLGSLRAGQYSVGRFLGGVIFLVLYGNTFSDLRDFAWVYSGWNHTFWFGKTYLAAIVAFVPRFLSEFRDTWSIGAVTASAIGVDPQEHPGLRPGIFGEGFFNFGVLGVLAVGLMLGIVNRRVDTDVKQALAAREPSMMKAYASTTLTGIAGTLALSAGFSGLYVLALILLFSWLCLGVVKLVRRFHAPIPGTIS